MKKKKVIRIRVEGQLDSLTDILKYCLTRQDGLTSAELLDRVERRMLAAQGRSKLEKNMNRCLEKNPCFYGGPDGWSLERKGERVNDQVFQWLQSAGKALNINELRALAAQRGMDAELLLERDLVVDGRFLRLKGGRWVLTTWEVIRPVSEAELDRVSQHLASAGRPLEMDQLARQVLKTGEEGTDLGARLQKDRRFAWVGGRYWFLRGMLPAPAEVAAALSEEVLPFGQAEAEALQEAELLLILNDSDPEVREYIVSAMDLEEGFLRVNRRMEKLFAALPPVAWVSFLAAGEPVEGWYVREAGLVLGLREWYAGAGLEPGAVVRVARVPGEERVFSLQPTGERDEQVYQEGQKLRAVLRLSRLAREMRWRPEDLLVEALRLFPEGLAEEELAALVGLCGGPGRGEMLEILDGCPYFRRENGRWHYQPEVHAIYREMGEELERVRGLLAEAHHQVAAALGEAEAHVRAREELQGELIYLQNHHREQEALLQEKIRALKQENQELQRENNRLKAELEKVGRQRHLLQQELEPARQQVVGLRAEREKLKDRVAQLEARTMQLQGALNRAMEDAQEEQGQLGQKVREMESRLASIMLANDDLQRTVVKLQQERRELKRKMSAWPVRLALALTGFFGGPGEQR